MLVVCDGCTRNFDRLVSTGGAVRISQLEVFTNPHRLGRILRTSLFGEAGEDEPREPRAALQPAATNGLTQPYTVHALMS